ncbi:MAG TPA: polyprenyl synthetase family protein [Actinomycetota bacterium]|nr:polyprenyl synthetase family protein [Actinomycetota bacterium]
MDIAAGRTDLVPPIVEAVRSRVDRVLASELQARRDELAALDPSAAVLVEELERLLAAGGKRLRPAFCYLGYRAAGGAEGEPIVRAAAALELLHTFALVHDDVMDEATERRGVETTQVRFSRAFAGASGARGRSAAVLVGDLAAVLAEALFRTSGFPPGLVEEAFARFDRMRLEMAAGQYLDLLGSSRLDLASAEHVAELKTGSYTVEGPLLIGAALAGAPAALESRLLAYGRPVGEAFQLRDDVLDHEAPVGAAERVDVLIEEAISALEGARLEPVAAAGLRHAAEAMRLGER